MAFLKEVEPPRGAVLPMLDGVSRIVAANPSVMTYHGTNTWLVEDGAGGLTLIDPGPDNPAHVQAILDGCAGRLARILVTHSHSDHIGAGPALRAATGVPVYGWAMPPEARFVPDHVVADDDSVAGLRALHTPGHAPDHLCFVWRDGVLFTGDHVMGWASSIVNPPDGDMQAYLASLRLLLARTDRLYLCGHGPIVTEPAAHTQSLLNHRIRREIAIAEAVRRAPAGTYELMDRLYHKLDPMLRRAAERNVLAHLIKLQREGLVTQNGEVWAAA
jgi:glyoxylase-like metal-dependent hydrolase (beta-lactamase superfamily II)